MAPFTEAQLLDELRTIFLYEAEHIALGAGPTFAERFIGFSSDGGSFIDEPTERVDLERYQITPIFKWAYSAAFQPSVEEWAGGVEQHEQLLTFMQGLPRIGSAGGMETHDFMGPNGCCQIVCDIIHARWKLEWVDHNSSTFTTRELALLANMSEGAVRNAMADKSGNGLKAIPGSKPVSVSHGEALNWLKGRRGFMPMPKRPSEDRFLHEKLKEIESAQELGKLISHRLSMDESSRAALASNGWAASDIAEWADGSFTFDQPRAVQLAEALDVDRCVFAGKALEVSLRRDTAGIGGRS